MGRKKKVFIHIMKLSDHVRAALLQELETMDEFDGMDLKNVKIVGVEKYTNVSATIAPAIYNLRKYISQISKDDCFVYGKKELSKILGISRPTLNKWIQEGVITECRHKYINLENILFQLSQYFMIKKETDKIY